jgi:hypothetical protein
MKRLILLPYSIAPQRNGPEVVIDRAAYLVVEGLDIEIAPRCVEVLDGVCNRIEGHLFRQSRSGSQSRELLERHRIEPFRVSQRRRECRPGPVLDAVCSGTRQQVWQRGESGPAPDPVRARSG